MTDIYCRWNPHEKFSVWRRINIARISIKLSFSVYVCVFVHQTIASVAQVKVLSIYLSLSVSFSPFQFRQVRLLFGKHLWHFGDMCLEWCKTFSCTHQNFLMHLAEYLIGQSWFGSIALDNMKLVKLIVKLPNNAIHAQDFRFELTV